MSETSELGLRFLDDAYRIVQDYIFDMLEEVERKIIAITQENSENKEDEKETANTIELVRAAVDKLAMALENAYEKPFTQFETAVRSLFASETEKAEEKNVEETVENDDEDDEFLPPEKKIADLGDGKEDNFDFEGQKEEFRALQMQLEQMMKEKAKTDAQIQQKERTLAAYKKTQEMLGLLEKAVKESTEKHENLAGKGLSENLKEIADKVASISSSVALLNDKANAISTEMPMSLTSNFINAI